MNQTTKRRMEQIKQRWRVVALITVLAVLATGAFSFLSRPTYTGKSTLMLASRTPEQDAVMALGYLTIFNDPATIARLKVQKRVPDDVAVEARAAATSPIITVETTADDPKVAQDGAEAIAQGFSDNINSSQDTGRNQYVADLERQLSDINPVMPDGASNPYYASLQVRIDDAKSNSSNQLQVLQARAGVSENAPNIVFNIAAGVVGGLLLGILAALSMAAMSRRVMTAADLRHKTGLDALAELPSTGSSELATIGANPLRLLANTISLQNMPRSRIIVLTEDQDGHAARDVAVALAKLSAQQGTRTALVYADNDPSWPAEGVGFNDALSDGGIVRTVLKDGDVDSLKILPAGAFTTDRYGLATRERIAALFNELRENADTVIVAAPSVASATETQLICAAADSTILLIHKGSRVRDLTAAIQTLAKGNAALMGVVFVDQLRSRHGNPDSHVSTDSWRLSDDRHADRQTESIV